MQIQDKIIPDQKIAVINYKGPISDLEVLLSKLMDWVETEEIKTIGEPFKSSSIKFPPTVWSL